MTKIIIRFPNKKLTEEERIAVARTFAQGNFICIDKEVELYEIKEVGLEGLNDNRSIKRVF